MQFPRRLQCVVLLAGALQALTPVVSVGAEAPHSAGRPRVGLVLAGGGAKGGAHVGVLKVLEELHVPIDCIAGTSMGALIGGGYAAGIPADELEKFLVNIDWKKVVGSQGRRDLEPIEQKRSGPTYSNDFELGITPNGVVTPGGLINTSNIEDLLRVYVARARLETDFDKLPIPYRAVATDMVSSKMVVLEQGDLATAMRASMAIPGGFAPVIMDDMILSDGGLVRNIPIDIARNLCAEQVIVVNLVEPEADPVKLQSATQLLGRSMDVMIIANEELQLASLRPGDVRIDVIMGDIGTADFERVPDTVPLGVTAAHKMSDELRKFSVPEAQYVAWRTAVTQSQQIEGRLAGVRFEGLKRVNPEYLVRRHQVKAGDPVDIVTISEEAQRISALQDFDSVSYRLDGDRSSPTLTWLPQEKKIGPNYLRVDLGVYASREGDLSFSIYGRHVRTWVNSLGAQWYNELQLGGESLVTTGFYQPLDVARRFFIEPRVTFSRALEDVFVDDERVARYEFKDFIGELNLGANVGRYGQARIGYLYDERDVDVDIGTPLMPEGKPVDAGMHVLAELDSRDTAFNPTRGLAMALEYMESDESMGGDRDWERAELGFGIALPLRRDVLWLTFAAGSDLGSDLPGDRAFSVGGPDSFPGFEQGELRVSEYWLANTSYLWRVKDLLSIRNHSLYVGVGLTGGQLNGRLDGGEDGEHYGGSVFLTGRTFFGPLTVGVGATSTDSWSLWLSVGRPVGHGTILERGVFR
ncbi:MAG TPA: patatin-like phospholipase family protein [Steroidobacteraceae bacterium]|nr:patatin-like phospholipase family protein [Steroidobacteraceae bacterium]